MAERKLVNGFGDARNVSIGSGAGGGHDSLRVECEGEGEYEDEALPEWASGLILDDAPDSEKKKTKNEGVNGAARKSKEESGGENEENEIVPFVMRSVATSKPGG